MKHYDQTAELLGEAMLIIDKAMAEQRFFHGKHDCRLECARDDLAQWLNQQDAKCITLKPRKAGATK